MKTFYQDKNNAVLDENSVERIPCINRESKSLEFTIKLYSCHDINMKFLVVVTPPYIYQLGSVARSWSMRAFPLVMLSCSLKLRIKMAIVSNDAREC